MGGAGLAASQLTGNLAMYLALQFGGSLGCFPVCFSSRMKQTRFPGGR